MIPLWKVRRELTRLTDQIIELPSYLKAFSTRRKEPARRASYERDFDTLTQLDTGKIPFGSKLAIYLIYQPAQIAESSFATLDWLIVHGYSPIVVSNTPVSKQDLHNLLERSSLVLKRPNFGYDFGGYKDGIKLIIRQGISPERLIIMNDSVWLPIAPDLLTRMEARQDVDILGIIEDEKIYHTTKESAPSGLKHVESYFYVISANAWRSDAFQSYWRDYKMTSSKRDTIKIGEIGFSHKMTAAGLSTGSLTSRAAFLEEISKRDNRFLQATLKYASYDDNSLRREGDNLRAADIMAPDWRERALRHVQTCINRKGFNSKFLYANDKIFGTLFMKKNKDKIFVEMRRNYLSAIQHQVLSSPPKIVLNEILKMVQQE